MHYGQPSPSRNRRRPRYDWTPSYSPARRNRRRKGARPYRRRTDDIDLSDHFLRPWLHDHEPWGWDGRSRLERHRDDQAILGAVEFIVIFFWKFLLVAGLVALAGLFLAKLLQNLRNEIETRGEASRQALRLGRRSSVHEPPTPERLSEAWTASRNSLEGKLLLGSLLSDIEPVVDRSYIRSEDGTIVGRRPGIKGWLSWNCPDLLPHYKALMAYKALADKVRLALGIADPDSLEEALAAAGWKPEDGHSGEGRTQDGGVEHVVAKMPMESITKPQEVGEKPQEGGGNEPKSMAGNIGYNSLNENVILKGIELKTMLDGLARPTMAALERAAREKLGVVWMVRGKPRRLAS